MKTALWTLVILSTISGIASAALLVDDNFDSYEDQLDFEAVWAPIGTTAPISGLLSTGQASSGPNSVENPRSSDPGRYHNQFTFAPSPLLGVGDQLIWSFDFYDKLPEGLPNSNFASLQTVANPSASPAGQLISMGLNPNQFQDDSGGNRYMARILGHAHAAVDPDGGPNESPGGTGLSAFFKLNDTGAALRGVDAGWHSLKLIITTSDGATVDHAYYVDNILAETVNSVGPVQQYGVIRIGSGLPNGQGAFYDNLRLEFVPAAIPEASSFAAVGAVSVLWAAGVCFRKHRAGRTTARN
jgi:hypothetical protein